jgi:hypothetical protein
MKVVRKVRGEVMRLQQQHGLPPPAAEVSTASAAVDAEMAEAVRLLGLSRAIPEAALRKFLLDPLFAHHLLVCRGSGAFMDMLFAEAETASGETATMLPADTTAAAEGSAPARSHTALAVTALRAIVRWARSGCPAVSEQVYARRLAACARCPHRQPAPSTAPYRLVRAFADDPAHACALCGCVVQSKARLATETCPAADPSYEGLNRWGEPLRK